MPTQQPTEEDERGAPRPLSTRLNAAAAWPPGYHERPGQRPPRRFSALSAIQALWPDYIKQFTGRVPEEFWTVEDEDAELGDRSVVIACPCGEEPKVRQNRTAICPGEECGRVFLLLGEEIRVATYDPEDLAPDQ